MLIADPGPAADTNRIAAAKSDGTFERIVTSSERVSRRSSRPLSGGFSPKPAAAREASEGAVAPSGLRAPKSTPADIVQTLNREINAGLADPNIKAECDALRGTLLPGSPADFAALIAKETEKWAQVIKFAGAKPE
jgi:tripartite-type tricarboxylate transporter receptor subunit TctC